MIGHVQVIVGRETGSFSGRNYSKVHTDIPTGPHFVVVTKKFPDPGSYFQSEKWQITKNTVAVACIISASKFCGFWMLYHEPYAKSYEEDPLWSNFPKKS